MFCTMLFALRIAQEEEFQRSYRLGVGTMHRMRVYTVQMLLDHPSLLFFSLLKLNAYCGSISLAVVLLLISLAFCMILAQMRSENSGSSSLFHSFCLMNDVRRKAKRAGECVGSGEFGYFFTNSFIRSFMIFTRIWVVGGGEIYS